MAGHQHNSGRFLQGIYCASDLLAILMAYGTTLYLRFSSELGQRAFTLINGWLEVRDTGVLDASFVEFYIENAPRIIGFLAATLLFLYAFLELYPGRRFLRPRPVAWDVIRANFIALMIFYMYFYLSRNEFHPRSMFFTMLALNVVYCLLFRNLTHSVLHILSVRRGWNICHTVLIGSGPQADTLRQYIEQVQPHGIQIAEQIVYNSGETWSEQVRRIEQACRFHKASLLLCADPQVDIPRIMQLLEFADEHGLSVKILSNKLNVLTHQARISADMFLETPLVHFSAPRAGHPLLLARISSVVLAAIALLLLAPWLLLIGLLIRLTSEGPAFFIQERIGINRQPFRMFKFRTMHRRAEEMQAQIEEFNEAGKGLFKIRDDPRVTRMGKLLRRFSLDEIPQLLNVVRGDMNLVGPRPLPRRDYDNYYEEWHYSRHDGLPGLTCLWQVSGRSEIDFHNMCILDIYYLRNRDVLLDLKILLRTLGVVLFAKGAY